MNTLLANLPNPLSGPAAALPVDRIWLVGGAVRDLLMGRTPTDYDIAVRGNPVDFAAAFARKAGGRPIAIGRGEHRMYRVLDGGVAFDFSRLAGADIEADLRRRDFTVNAMAVSPADGAVIDPLGGRDDLKKRRVRVVSGRVFEEDPVRLVRAFRMAAVFDLTLETGTEDLIGRQCALVDRSAGERVRDELFKLLAAERSGRTVAAMHLSGLLGRIFPELAGLAGCHQGPHHRHDVLQHTLNVFDHLESILADPARWLPRRGKEAKRLAVRRKPALLKIAALLHDIGKPAARGEDAGRIHFRGHAGIGLQMAEAAFARLHLSNRDRRYTGFLIGNHPQPLQLFIARQRQALTPKGRTRFFVRSGAMTAPLLLLALADTAGKQTPPGGRPARFGAFADDLLEEYFESFRPKREKPPLITGTDLIASLRLSPSPLFGRILGKIEVERLEGRLATREDAMARARELADAWHE